MDWLGFRKEEFCVRLDSDSYLKFMEACEEQGFKWSGGYIRPTALQFDFDGHEHGICIFGEDGNLSYSTPGYAKENFVTIVDFKDCGLFEPELAIDVTTLDSILFGG